MEFDDAKENIQPLAAGRNVSILQAALQADSQQELQQQRIMFEESIKNCNGNDPLEPWFEYIYWIEQSFPSGGKESGLEEVLLKCLTKFEKDKRYYQDRRMIKLYNKYIDTHENPQECYQQLYNQGIGTMVSDLYICWAYYYDLSGNFRKADQIFRRGIDCHAEPFDELQEAHQHFGFTMSQRILYDDDNSKQKFQSTLQEKRQALTSLKSHKHKVGSVRTGNAIKSYGPGKIQLDSTNLAGIAQRLSVCVLEDKNQDPYAIPPPESSAVTSKSVVKTILDSARKQENVKEPGPWNKAHDKKKGQLFVSKTNQDLGFEILIDEVDTSSLKPFVHLDGFVERNELQEEWNVPVTIENELVPNSYPAYDKCMLYPKPNKEYSQEELAGYNWYKRRNIKNIFLKMYDKVWKLGADSGIRMYPNFATKSRNPPEGPISKNFDPLEANVIGKSKLILDPQIFYPKNEEELQFEEIMCNRWKSGERLKHGGNETIVVLEEMEETHCMPDEAPRRKSFLSRKSIMPPQLAALPRNLEETKESETAKVSTVQEGFIKKPPPKATDDECGALCDPINPKEEHTNKMYFAFKTPTAPPVKQQKLPFQIYEEDENKNEADETCSTQVFNCFIKAQSASTPKAPAKIIKPMNLNCSGVENIPLPPTVNGAFSPLESLEYYNAALTIPDKRLSTIMETSEQATGHTASTKSSISSADFEVSTVPVRQHYEIFNFEQRENTVPKMPVVSIFEDKTETVPRLIFEKAGNFSYLENGDATTPSFKSVKLNEDNTDIITKMKPISKNLVGNESPTDEIMEFFAKSPVDNVFNSICTSPLVPVANKSFTESAFMNFLDSPEAKLKCDYDTPEMRLKHLSLSGVKKALNLSILPNFGDTMKVEDGENIIVTESSFLPNLYSVSGSENPRIPANDLDLIRPPIQLQAAIGNLSLQQSKKHSFSQRSFKESKEDSSNALPREMSKEDCFLSGFPSVTVGSNLDREDSFMSYLSNVGAPISKQLPNDSMINKLSPAVNDENTLINAGGPTCPKRQTLSQPGNTLKGDTNALQMNPSQSFLTLSFPTSFSGKELSKQPDGTNSLSIFDNSNCQKTATISDMKQESDCNAFENSNCKSGVPYLQTNKIVSADISLKPVDFFEDNIRTEAFQANLSTIKNSTWLPNHDQQPLKTMKLSEIMANKINTSITPNNQKSHGLSMFSSVPPNESFKSSKALLTSPPCDSIEILDSDEQETDDLGKSIYYKKTPMTPKIVRHTWSPEAQQPGLENNIFMHRQVNLDQTQQLLDNFLEEDDFSPFNTELKDTFLCQIDFTNYIEKLSPCEMVRKIQPLRKDCTIEINGKLFNVQKLIGEGSYGAVYCAKEPQSGRMFALKQERPANLWEYYICLELHSRLHNTQILSGFINIEYALIGNNAGILVSQFSRYGSLITVCNKIKKETSKNVDEYVVMHLASQLLLIMDHLHASNIIHADVKPDNFLLMEKLVPGRKQPTIQLIDFGTSIDMSLFKKGQTFRFIHKNVDFKCVEMHEKRPWTFQLDLFGLAGVIHVLLFGKYMDILKKTSGWTHKTHVPRYFNKSLWETIFYSLLNIENCQTMPNLQNLRAQLEDVIAENDKSVCQKIVEFNRALDL